MYPVALFVWGVTPGGFAFFSDDWGRHLLGINPFYSALCVFYFLVVSESRHKWGKLLTGCAVVALVILALSAIEVQCWNARHDLEWTGAERWRHTLALFMMQFFPFAFLGWGRV